MISWWFLIPFFSFSAGWKPIRNVRGCSQGGKHDVPPLQQEQHRLPRPQCLQVLPGQPWLWPAHDGAGAEVPDHPQCRGSKQVRRRLSLMHVTDPDPNRGQWVPIFSNTGTGTWKHVVILMSISSVVDPPTQLVFKKVKNTLKKTAYVLLASWKPLAKRAGSGSVSKCHGSTTLVFTFQSLIFLFMVKLAKL